MANSNKYTISRLAEEFDISTRTIRFYEEKGLLAPDRSNGGHRRFTSRDRARLKLILRGKHFGHSLDEIADMIGLASEGMDEVSQIMKSLEYGDRSLQEIHDRMQDLQRMERDIIDMKKKLNKRLEELGRKTSR